MGPRIAFEHLNRITGLAPLTAPSFSGAEAVLPSPFRAPEAAAASLGFSAAVAAEIWRLRGGERQSVSIDLDAAAASLVSFALLRLDGQSPPRPALDAPAVGFYRCADGRWIFLHGGFPGQWPRMLDLLNALNSKASVAQAVGRWNSLALEDALGFLNLAGAVARAPHEWAQSPQGRALAKTPPIVIRKIGDAPPLRLGPSNNPLDGVRALDLTRVLAGPACARTLASYGAEALHIRAERLETIEPFDLDTGHGKRSAYLDLAHPADAETLRKLVRKAHLFIDSYRPGALARLGFTPAALAHIASGITYVSISCYGLEGPWAGRRGWEQIAQSATGLAHEQGQFLAVRRGGKREAAPELIPAAVCDYVTGYLAAAGAAAALLRRMREGGSWRVEVSLCATAMWLASLGTIEPGKVPESWAPGEGLDAYRQSCETGRGRLDFLGPVARMSKTAPAWRLPPPEPGADRPRWQDRSEEMHAAEEQSA